MPRQSRAADQRRLADEHARGVGQGAKRKKAAPEPAPDPPKRKRGRPKKSAAEHVSKAWEVLRKRYSDEAHRVVAGLKAAGLSVDDLVAMEIAELVELQGVLAGLKKNKQWPSYAKLQLVAQQARKQLFRLLVMQGGHDVNMAEVQIPEGLEILLRPARPIIGDDVLAKPDLSKLPERYR